MAVGSSVSKGQRQLLVVSIHQRQLSRRKVLPSPQRHHQRPLVRQILQPPHVKHREIPHPRSIFLRSCTVSRIPDRMRWQLDLKYHPAEEGPTDGKGSEAGKSLKAKITDLTIVEQHNEHQTVKSGEILDESPSSHEDNGDKLQEGNIAEQEFLESHFDMGSEESLIDPHNAGVVDEVEEEEVEEHGFADLGGGLLDDGGGRGIADDGVDADPGEEFEDLVQTLHPHVVADLEQNQDDCGCCHDGSVDVQRSDDGDDHVGDDNFGKHLQFDPHRQLLLHVQHEGSLGLHDEPLLQEDSHGIIDEFIDDQIIEIENDGPQSLDLFEYDGIVVIVHGISLLLVHKHPNFIVAEHQIAALVLTVVLIRNYATFIAFQHQRPLLLVVLQFHLRWQGFGDVVEGIVVDFELAAGEAGGEVGIVGEDDGMAEEEEEGEDQGHGGEGVADALPPELGAVVLEGAFGYAEQVLLNLHPPTIMLTINYTNQSEIRMEFNRYQIPPDFDMCELHHEAAMVYDERSDYRQICPCCERRVGDTQVSICSDTAKLMRISEELPLYFSYLKAVFIALLAIMVVLIGQLSFSASIQEVNFKLDLPTYGLRTLQLGFVDTNRWWRFGSFLFFSVIILLVRGYLKKSKYEVRYVIDKISNRTAMLVNVPRRATIGDILEVFDRDGIENVVLTYKVKGYCRLLEEIYRADKELQVARERRKSSKDIEEMKKSIPHMMAEANKASSGLRNPENRLDFAFVTFKDEQTKKLFFARYENNFFSRLYYKWCTCCSRSSILGQHVSVVEAPDPEDIDWLNLQADYWTKKLHRLACYYMCFAILIYGIMFQYELSTLDFDSFYQSIIKSGVVFVVNFLIISLLEYTTNEVEKHELNTNKILSLVRKLTFFIFLNLSMSPLSIYVYEEYSLLQKEGDLTPLDNLCFSVLVICLGNILKPLAEYFNVTRIMRFIGFYSERSKREDCEMTQQEANQAFEPIPFPIASFYSLLISSLFVTSFFLSCFQLLVVIELFACGLLFLISKYMLLRVCKQPIGLNNKISILCQRLLSLTIYSYWIGEKVMYFFLVEKDNLTFQQYLENYTTLDIVELVLLALTYMFSPKLLSLLSHRMAEQDDIRDSFIQKANANMNRMTYEEVNSIKRIEEEYFKYFAWMER